MENVIWQPMNYKVKISNSSGGTAEYMITTAEGDNKAMSIAKHRWRYLEDSEAQEAVVLNKENCARDEKGIIIIPHDAIVDRMEW